MPAAPSHRRSRPAPSPSSPTTSTCWASNPLTGPNDERHGPRFPDMSAVYDPGLVALIEASGAASGIPLAKGVYLATPGPSFETPAEIRAFRSLGADLVGMSTVPEAILARHAGLKVLGLSIVTNRAAGLADQPLSHDETLAMAGQAAGAARAAADRRDEGARSPCGLISTPFSPLPMRDRLMRRSPAAWSGRSTSPRSTATRPQAEIEALCALAMSHGVAAVCVLPQALPVAARCLAGGTVRLATVVNFPAGGDDLAGHRRCGGGCRCRRCRRGRHRGAARCDARGRCRPHR